MSTHDDTSSENPLSRSFWRGPFDIRPVALVRIALGVMILVNLLELHAYLGDWYTDHGAVPRWLLLGGMVRAARICLLDAVGARWVVEVYWAVAVVVAAAFTVGWRTRLANGLLFVLLSGFIERNLSGLDSSDTVERVMLFWLFFFPSGARYSVDALLRVARDQPVQKYAPAFVARLAQLQIAWVYLAAFFGKMRGPMWLHGTALHYALGLDHVFTRGLGRLLFHCTWFTVAGTYFTILFEGAFFFLVLSPWKTGRLRAAALVAGVMLHAGIFATMSVGNFSLVMIATYPLFFLPAWLDRAHAYLLRPDGNGSTLMVAALDCSFCRRLLAVLSACDLCGRLRIVDASEIGERAFVDAGRTRNELYAVGPDGELRRGWFALVAAAQRSPLLWPAAMLAQLPLVRALAPALYAYHARHGSAPRPLPAPARPLPAPRLGAPALIGTTLLALLFAGGVWDSAPPAVKKHMPRWYTDAVEVIDLWQNWDMFAPTPAHVDTWFKSDGQLTDGRHVDVLRDDDGPFPAPDVGLVFNRWRKYSLSLVDAPDATWREFGRFLCRRWNDDRPASRAPLKEFKIYLEQRKVAAPHAPPEPWRERMFWHQICF